jgi:hypothetical protein
VAVTAAGAVVVFMVVEVEAAATMAAARMAAEPITVAKAPIAAVRAAFVVAKEVFAARVARVVLMERAILAAQAPRPVAVQPKPIVLQIFVPPSMMANGTLSAAAVPPIIPRVAA